MLAWFALVVSVVGLFVNIIINRDKLKTFVDDLSNWQQQQIEKKKVIAAIKKYSAREKDTVKQSKAARLPKLNMLYTSQFFLSGILSAITNFLAFPSLDSLRAIFPYLGSWISIFGSVLLYFLILRISLILIRKQLRATSSRNLRFLIFVTHTTVVYILTWALFTLTGIYNLSFEPFYAGLISGTFLYILSLSSIKQERDRQ